MELHSRCAMASAHPDGWDVRGLLEEAGMELAILELCYDDYRKATCEAMSGLYAIAAILHETCNPVSVIATDLIERVNGIHRSLSDVHAIHGQRKQRGGNDD